MFRTLYIDIDSTIWPAEDEYDKTCLELYGEPFGKDWYDVDQLVEKYGKDYWQIFEHALDPAKVHERVLYPYTAWAMNFLYGMGFELHFLSHNPKPSKMDMPVYAWLQDKLSVPFNLTIFGARNDKITFMMQDQYAWGIIEDKPTTLVKAHKAGYVTIAMRHPWNVKVCEERGIMIADSWQYIPGMVVNVLEKGYNLAMDSA